MTTTSSPSLSNVHPTHGAFIQEGLMVAFPLCFPGVTDPIPLEESRITALTMGENGVLYGGTGGRRAHLFAACFTGVTGAVWDLGPIDDATHCAAIACGRENLVAALNGPAGSRILTHQLERVPDSDLLQEWVFIPKPYQPCQWQLPHERILDLVAIPQTPQAIGITENHLFQIHIDENRSQVITEVDSTAHLMVDANGTAYGLDDDNTLWTFHAPTNRLTRKAIPLPSAAWREAPLVWTRNAENTDFYLADPTGNILSFSPASQTCQPITQTPLAPITCMAAIPDGRVYGFCGSDISHLFVFDPRSGSMTDLGVAVSVIERRRYGYRFAAAVTNRDGHLIFGEDDNLGHLWLYFPAIPHPASHA